MDNEVRKKHKKIVELQNELKGSYSIKDIYNSNLSTRNGVGNKNWKTKAVGLSESDKDLDYRVASPQSSEDFYAENKCDKKIWIVSDGKLVVEYKDGNSVTLRKDECETIPKKTTHKIKNESNESVEFVVLYKS